MNGVGTVIIQGGGQIPNAGPISATVSDAPRSLVNQPSGTLLHGTVEGRTRDHLLIRTELGLLRLAAQANPPTGARVSVQVQTVGPQTTVYLHGAHGHGLGRAPQASGTANLAAAPLLPPGVPPALAPGATLQALLQPAVTPPLASAPTQAIGNPTQGLPGTLSNTATTGALGNQGAAMAGQGAGQGTGQGAGQGTAGQAAAALDGNGPRAGHNLGGARPVGLHIMSVHPPGVSGAAAAAAAAQAGRHAVVLSGIVTGSNGNGQVTLHTALGTVTLDAKAEVPRGTQFNLAVIGPRPAGGGAYGSIQAVLSLARAYPELGQLVALLNQIDPAAAQTLLHALPQAGAPMTAGILFFLGALRFGDVRSWLGADGRLAVERAGRTDLLRGLGDGLSRLGRAAAEQPAGEWRALPIPIANGSVIEQIMVFVRNHSDGNEKGDGADQGTRFVVEFSLSHYGQMQIDGLVHTRNKRFDLIVRSRDPLTNGVRHRISELFETANEISGFKGGVGFQSVNRFPVSPLEEMARSARGTVA